MNMTDEERRAKSPKFTQEYDDEQQLVVFSDGKTLSYSPASQYDAAESMNLKEQTQVHFQSAAMYKSQKENFDDFYNLVQKNNNPKQKSYYTQITKGNVKLDIFHDIVMHDIKKHSLTVDEWKELFDVIDDNIEEKQYAQKAYYRGTPILLKIKSGNKYFGVSLEIFENRNIITTAFKSTSKGVDVWMNKDKNKSARTTAPNHQSRSSVTQNNIVIPGQTLNNIINYVKTNLNPDVNKHEEIKPKFQSNDDMNSNIENARGFTYQRKNFDGTEKENLIVLLNKKADKSTLMHELIFYNF